MDWEWMNLLDQRGIENFPAILENMMIGLGARSVDFFKTVLKKCSDGLDTGSVEEAWMKVVLKSFDRRRCSTPGNAMVLVLGFEKLMTISEKVRDSGEEDWASLISDLESISVELEASKDSEHVDKLKSRILPLKTQLRSFHELNVEINRCKTLISRRSVDLSVTNQRLEVDRVIQCGMSAPCDLLREAAIELKCSLETRELLTLTNSLMTSNASLTTKNNSLTNMTNSLTQKNKELQRDFLQKQDEVNFWEKQRENVKNNEIRKNIKSVIVGKLSARRPKSKRKGGKTKGIGGGGGAGARPEGTSTTMLPPINAEPGSVYRGASDGRTRKRKKKRKDKKPKDMQRDDSEGWE